MSFECVAHDALDDHAFLNEQLQWTFTDGKGEHSGCVLDKICKSLNRYNDFYGLFCCYDGNRNLQLHLEWDSRTLSPEKFPNPYVKDDKMVVYEPAEICLMFYWEVVAKMIQEVIEEERGIAVNFNTVLRNAIDNGIRKTVHVCAASRCFELDPFNGSGSTGIAAMLTGRKYIGIELDAVFCKLTPLD